jgi:hypothetical protein
MIFGSALVPMARGSSGQVVLTPTDDAYVDGNWPSRNYGSQPYLQVSLIDYAAFLKFSLSGIPKGAVGIFGMLELCTTLDGVTADHLVSACWEPNNFNQWTEETITCDNIPFIPFFSKKLYTVYVANNEVWYAWNITEAVANVTASNPANLTISMIFPGDREDPRIRFNSKEGTLGRTPKLTVSWTDIVLEFPSVLILPTLMLATLLAVAVSRGRQSKRTLKNKRWQPSACFTA